jgi:hypothetical protein
MYNVIPLPTSSLDQVYMKAVWYENEDISQPVLYVGKSLLRGIGPNSCKGVREPPAIWARTENHMNENVPFTPQDLMGCALLWVQKKVGL